MPETAAENPRLRALAELIIAGVEELRQDAADHEITYLAIALSGTKRRKRPLPMTDVGGAMFRLFILYGSKKALAEKLGMSTESVREWLLLAFGPWSETAKQMLEREHGPGGTHVHE